MAIGTHDGQYYESEIDHIADRPVTIGPSKEKQEDVPPINMKKPTTQDPPGTHDPAGGGGIRGDFSDPDQDMMVIRHGTTALNEKADSPDLVRGWKNVPLDEHGREEAKRIAEEKRNSGIDEIWTSDLDRAADTAKELSRTTGAPVVKSFNLRPWNVGDLTGKAHAEVHPVMKDHVENPDKPLPGGESFNEFKERALAGVEEAMAQTPGKNLAIVTHHRVERLLNAWEKKGQPDDHTIDVAEFLKKGEPTGTAQAFKFSKKPVDSQQGLAGAMREQGFSREDQIKGLLRNNPNWGYSEWENPPSKESRRLSNEPGHYPWTYKGLQSEEKRMQDKMEQLIPRPDIEDYRPWGQKSDRNIAYKEDEPYTPLTQKEHDDLMYDTPVVSSKGPNGGPTKEEVQEMLDTPQAELDKNFNDLKDYFKEHGWGMNANDAPFPEGRIRGWKSIPGFKEYMKNLPDDVTVHDMKDGTIIFQKVKRKPVPTS